MVELLVREEPCKEHPGEEWLTLKIDGHEVMSICTGGLKAFARNMRGKDMIQWSGPESKPGAARWPRLPG